MTLVEILTAMMVSVILIGTAFSTFWAATQAWDKAKRRSEMFRLSEGVSQIITRYLRTMQPPFLEGNSVLWAIHDSDEVNDYDSICFLSSANPRFPRELDLSDLCEVEFYVETAGESATGATATGAADTRAGMTNGMGRPPAGTAASETEQTQGGLWMRIDPTPDDDIASGGYLIELGEQITSLAFRFFDGVEWVDEWFDDTVMPEVVEFSITISDPLERENPLTLTRLVHIPTAKAFNEGALSATVEEAATTSGTTSSGAPSGTSSSSGAGPSSSPGGGSSVSGGGSGGGGSSSGGGGGGSRSGGGSGGGRSSGEGGSGGRGR